ncbi:MAG: S-adenosylmethionine:tRNA ribosyltransferase-isomerase [Bdellovibrionales bacterium]
MKRSDLQFSYPESLIALKPELRSRVMWTSGAEVHEKKWEEFIEQFREGDVLVVNNTSVVPRRVRARSRDFHFDVIFVKQKSPKEWEVLLPMRKIKELQITLAGDVGARVLRSGLPQTLLTDEELDLSYFRREGLAPLPPYILFQRQLLEPDQDFDEKDLEWYQSIFAQDEHSGSYAAPTASLHFKKQDLETLKQKGVQILPITLHVGLGTFLPITTEDLNDHPMHAESVEIPFSTWTEIQKVKAQGGHVWGLGTTVVRSLESQALGLLQEDHLKESFVGETRLLIQEGFKFQVIDKLLTNFHQPESTLLALVAAFAGLDQVKKSYQWAVEKQFRLFSYGDLTVWER